MESDYLKKQIEKIDGEMARLYAERSRIRLEQTGNHPLSIPLEPVERLETEGKTAAYCGVPGAYAYEATVLYFGENMKQISVSSFDAALAAIDQKAADYAVLPIENSSAGAVGNVYDILAEHAVYVVGEIDVPISHCLLVRPETEMEDIREVHSHSQALQQCRHYLTAHPEWTQLASSNTALSAKMIAEGGHRYQAAIASEAAGRLYGLKVLEKGINQNNENTTRFVIVTGEQIYLKTARKIRICVECLHQKGALYQLLSHFAYHNLNMTRIESRPIPERTWEYRFFMDFEGSLQDPNVVQALSCLNTESTKLRILGNC